MHVRMRTADRRVSPWQQHDYSREPGKAKLEDTKYDFSHFHVRVCSDER